MHDVMICLVSEKDLKSKLIQWITGSQYNHVFIEFHSGEWRGRQRIDITERGVIQLPVENQPYNEQEVVRYRAKECIEKAIVARKDMIGNRYDWKGLFGGLVKMIVLRLFGRVITRPWHSKGRLFCSEYVATLLGESDANNYSLDPWVSRPTDIMRYCRLNLNREQPLRE